MSAPAIDATAAANSIKSRYAGEQIVFSDADIEESRRVSDGFLRDADEVDPPPPPVAPDRFGGGHDHDKNNMLRPFSIRAQCNRSPDPRRHCQKVWGWLCCE